MKGYDIIGNIAIVKFDRKTKAKDKRKQALHILKKHKSVTTVLEKAEKIKGRLRTLKTKWVAGEKTKEALYRENGCIFRLNVDTCYFSPRLSQERLEIAKMAKKEEQVLVMFGGVAPYAIVIAKFASPKKVVSVELSRECNKYALENVKRNKPEGRVQLVQGDVRRVLPRMKEKFDRIIMARPNLDDSFLDVAFPRIKKGGTIHYYGFCHEDELAALKFVILQEVKEARRKIKILRVKKAGDIGVRKFRWRIDFKVLN